MKGLLGRSTELIGNVEGAYLGHSTEPTWRETAASGGAVSQILLSLLEGGSIDGALVTRLAVSDGVISAETFLARSRDELREAQGSKYIDTTCMKALHSLRDEEGVFAVVGLPCHLRRLRALEAENPELKEKIALRIGLFCGGSHAHGLLYDVLSKLGVDRHDIASFRFKQGHWRGRMSVTVRSGEELSWPWLGTLGMYKNLYLDVLPRCLSCTDHMAEQADLSCGDVWLPEMRADPVKHTLILARSDWAHEALLGIAGGGDLELTQISIEKVILAQRRSLIFKKRAIGARRRLAPLFGFRIENGESVCPPAWNDYVGSFFVLMNARLSRNRLARRVILSIPRPLLKLCMYFIALTKHF